MSEGATTVIQGRPVVAGEASGPLLLAREPISFWGGYDPLTGEIIDRRHELSGRNAAGHILAIPHTRGSSTSTAILLESVRTGHAPAAVIICRNDPFLALAAVVADVQYEASLPIVMLTQDEFDRLPQEGLGTVDREGRISLTPAP